jgi:antitoxin CptB
VTLEAPEVRLKRLRLRSMRRGIKEMDLLLGAFARDGLERLPADRLDAYEALLEEADIDLLNWITGQAPPPAEHAALVAHLAAGARAAANSGRFEAL